jgi:hypothetical protein
VRRLGAIVSRAGRGRSYPRRVTDPVEIRYHLDPAVAPAPRPIPGVVTRPVVASVEGIGAGSTLAEARTAYGDRLVVEEDVCGPWVFLRSDPQGIEQESIVLVSGPGDGDTRVRELHAGS